MKVSIFDQYYKTYIILVMLLFNFLRILNLFIYCPSLSLCKNLCIKNRSILYNTDLGGIGI